MEDYSYLHGGVATMVEEEKEIQAEDVQCFVLLEDSNNFFMSQKSYDINILGNSMFTWVVRACLSIPTIVASVPNQNVLETIRPYMKSSKYILVLYSDTPLITKKEVAKILDFVNKKGLNVCKLSRGFVFKTDYIKRAGEIYAPQTYYFNEEDFVVCDNYQKLDMITTTLKKRILEFHRNNGVFIENPEQTIIESNVFIGKNSVIKGNTKLLGRTEIGENTKIISSEIDSSKVCDNCNIDGAYIKQSVVKNNVCIMNNTCVFDMSLVEENTTIGINNTIITTSVGENVVIGNNSYLSNVRVGGFAKIGTLVRAVGEENKIIKVSNNVTIGDVVTIRPGVQIGENVAVSSYDFVQNNLISGENNG